MLKFVYTKPPRGRSSGTTSPTGSLERSASPKHRERIGTYPAERERGTGSRTHFSGKEKGISTSVPRKKEKTVRLSPDTVWDRDGADQAWGQGRFLTTERDRCFGTYPESRQADLGTGYFRPRDITDPSTREWNTGFSFSTTELDRSAKLPPFPVTQEDKIKSKSATTPVRKTRFAGLPEEETTGHNSPAEGGTIVGPPWTEKRDRFVGRVGDRGETKKEPEVGRDKCWRPRFFSTGSRSSFAASRTKNTGSKSDQVCICLFCSFFLTPQPAEITQNKNICKVSRLRILSHKISVTGEQ